MANPFEYQRFKNIFDPSIMGSNGIGSMPNPGMGPTPNFSQPAITTPPVQSMGGNDFDVTSRMGELYQPEMAAQKRFEELQGQYPQYQAPGFWRAAAGALSAFGPGGHDIGMKVANQGNDLRMQEWKSLLTPAQQAADNERQENINRRTLAHQTIQGELTQRRDEGRIKATDEANRIRNERMEIYRLRSNKPNFRFDFSGPTVLIGDPTTGKVTNTGISTGSLSETDKLELQQEHSLDRISATGKETRKTEDTRQEGRETLQDMRAWQQGNIPDPADPTKQIPILYNTLTGETKRMSLGGNEIQGPVLKGAPPAGSTPSETQRRTGNFNKALEIWNTREDLRPYMQRSGNDFILKPGSSWTDAGKAQDAAKRKELIELLYPKGTGNTTTLNTGNQSAPGVAPKAPAGWKYVPKPGGGWTAVQAGK
jgi:hypothetical protein